MRRPALPVREASARALLAVDVGTVVRKTARYSSRSNERAHDGFEGAALAVRKGAPPAIILDRLAQFRVARRSSSEGR